MNKMAGMLQNAPFKFAPENGLAYFEDLGWLTVEVESVFEAAHRFHRLTMLTRTRSRNAIPLLVGYIGDAVVGDHWSPRVRHAAINVEARTKGTRDLAVGLGIPTLVVRIGLTGRENHRGGIRCIADARASPGGGHALNLTGRVEIPELGFRPIASVDHRRSVVPIRDVETPIAQRALQLDRAGGARHTSAWQRQNEHSADYDEGPAHAAHQPRFIHFSSILLSWST
jgi:hypothetical protein